jgi:hypothetical protein
MKYSKIKNIEKTDILLLGVLVLGGIVRYWGIDFGLPHTQCRPDEEFVTNIIFSPVRSFHPGSFNYPSFYKYLLLTFYSFYFLVGIITGKYSSMKDYFTDYYLNPEVFYLIDRCLAALFGTLTILIVYKTAKQLSNKRTAILASVFMSLAYLHVRDSHFGCVDVPQTFFIMCAVLFMVRSYQEKTLKNYVIAGIFTGFATSTKYAGILLIAPMYAVHFFNITTDRGKGYKVFIDKRIWLFMVALTSAFLLGTPFCLIDPSGFLSDFRFEVQHLTKGHFIPLGIGWWYHLRFSLFFGLGWPLLFASIAGILIHMKTDLKKAIIVYAFPLIYYLSAGRGYTVFLRYMDPVIPFLCIAGAMFTIFIGDRLAGLIHPQLINVLIFSCSLFVLYPSTYGVIHFNRLIAKKDNRLMATKWVYENLPTGSSVYQPGFLWGQLQLPSTRCAAGEAYKEITVTANRNGKAFRVEINCPGKQNVPVYEQWNYHREKEKFEFENRIINTLPRCIVVEESPLSLWSPPPPESIQKLLKSAYDLKKSFKVVDCDNKENLYDQQDAFYVPFTGFKNVERPGPNIYVYERKQGY